MQIYSLNSLSQGTGAVKQGAVSAVPLGSVRNAGASNTELTASGASFTDLLGDLIDNIKTTEAAAEAENRKILTGESDDTHSALIASQKAQIAVELAVAVRDKVIAAYNEVMNMQV